MTQLIPSFREDKTHIVKRNIQSGKLCVLYAIRKLTISIQVCAITYSPGNSTLEGSYILILNCFNCCIQLSAVRQELEEAKQAMIESENKLKFKEETAAAAMAARDAAEKSLKLADLRSSRLRERLEELTRQLEESDNREDLVNRNMPRYACWPWQWLGLNLGSHAEVHQSSNEMELSEPLL